MKITASILLAALLTACAGTYQPAVDGPTIKLMVEQDLKHGVPLLSSAGLTLYMDQVGPDKIPGTDLLESTSLGWQKIPKEGLAEPFVLPADKPLKLMLAYRSDQVLGPALVGSQTYLLLPDAGASYVMKFWTDKKHFTVELWEESPTGDLVPARAMVQN